MKYFFIWILPLAVIWNVSLAIAESPSSRQTTQIGDTLLRFIEETPKHGNNCIDFLKFYQGQLLAPISDEEKQLISIWGDLYLCTCRVALMPRPLAGIKSEIIERNCQLPLNRNKYGKYVSLVIRLNERLADGKWKILFDYITCAENRLRRMILTDSLYEACLDSS